MKWLAEKQSLKFSAFRGEIRTLVTVVLQVRVDSTAAAKKGTDAPLAKIQSSYWAKKTTAK